MSGKTIFWYDFETFGADPRRDRVAQFAGVRTDENLNIVDAPTVLYCQPADDFLPSPIACLITGITPRIARERGVCEAEFIKLVHRQFSTPGTCVAGYNSIRFDDEFTRRLLYRNFYDPYEREWKNGNSRWDIIDMLRLCAAVRPDGINWPVGSEGHPSFRLEDLTAANGISHAGAHDALVDVYATIEVARLVMQHQPRLFEYVYNLRRKQQVEQHIDLVSHKPFVHVSSMYPAARGCLALVAPLCRHPADKNGIVVYDLREDPDSLQNAGPEEIHRRVFTRVEDLDDGDSRIPLKTLHLNRCPVVAPKSILPEEAAARFAIDFSQCQDNWNRLLAIKDLVPKISAALVAGQLPEETDPDLMIYSGGFFSEGDRKLMAVVRESTADQLAMLDLPFRDRRLPEMLFRYRARNYPLTLDREERGRWESFRRSRLLGDSGLDAFRRELDEACQRCESEEQRAVLEELREYVEDLLPASEP